VPLHIPFSINGARAPHFVASISLTYKPRFPILPFIEKKFLSSQGEGVKDMNRFVISIFFTISLCLSVFLALAGGVTSPDVINPGAQGVGRQDVINPGPGNSCNARDGFVYTQYNGKGMCVRCTEKNGWRYDGNKNCIK